MESGDFSKSIAFLTAPAGRSLPRLEAQFGGRPDVSGPGRYHATLASPSPAYYALWFIIIHPPAAYTWPSAFEFEATRSPLHRAARPSEGRLCRSRA